MALFDESCDSPFHAQGRYGYTPTAVIMHATRAPVAMEHQYDWTLSWFCNPWLSSEVSAHAVVGHLGQSCRCVQDEDTAWHVGWHNPYTLGIELAQPSWEEPFTVACLNKAADITAYWCKKYRIPVVFLPYLGGPNDIGITGHENTAQGISQGKTDPGRYFPWDSFIKSVNAKMSGAGFILPLLVIGGIGLIAWQQREK